MPKQGGWGQGLGMALLGVVTGTGCQLQQAALWPAAHYAACALAGAWAATLAAWLGRRGQAAFAALAWGGAGLALAFALTGWRAGQFGAQALAAELEGRDLVLTGVVAAMPQRGDAGLRFRFEIDSATDGGQPVALPRHVMLGWYGGVVAAAEGAADLQRAPADLRPGERWQLTARLKAPHGHLNPHGFDYELWLWEQGVQATGYVRAGPRDAPPLRLAATWAHPVEQARQAVRDAIFRRLGDGRAAGVVAALAVGDQRAIERADWDVFRATGVAHLMSISGLHVTMFAWAAVGAIGWLWRRSARLCLAWPAPQAALAGGVLLAAAYAVFSGWGVPAQRTVWMLATVAALRLLAREWPWPWVWLVACAVVVGVDPWALTQAGFWLSFVAVGVLFASGSGAADAPVGALARAAALLREQWVVTAALTPLSLLLFGQVSLVGLVANLVAIPWVTLVVTPLALAGIVLAPLWLLAGWAVGGLSHGLGLLAALPFATVSAPAAPVWAGVAGVIGGLLLVMRWPLPLRLMGVPLLLPVLLWQVPRPAEGEFDLLAADVGQGNAVLVRTAGRTLVYDAGPRYGPESDAGHRVLVPLLRALDARVDLLVLSHRDSDHTGGAAAVLAMQPQAGLLSSIEPGHPLHALRPARRCEAGQTWTWDGVRFEVLHPSAADYALPAPRPNVLSCVLRIGNGRRAVLLAGDIERAQEARLAELPGGLRADLLLAPHHGSKTSSSAALLMAVAPREAIVQAGYRNRFGHPAPEVAARYRAYGVPLLTSDRCGAMHWRSDTADGVTCERERARRYWHHVLP